MPDYLFADAHCHLDMVAGLPSPTILHITSGVSHETNLKSLRIASEYPNIYFCAGISPQEAQQHKDVKIKLVDWEEAIATQMKDSGKLVAIGEIGLDYKWATTEEQKFLQSECFISQLQLAERLSLPVVIHSRDAEEQCLEILRNFNLNYLLHCFSGKKETADAAVAHKGIISIPPLRNKERKQIIRDLPLEKLVAESDAPGIGKTPSDTLTAIKMIAEIKEIDEQSASRQTLMNTAAFFGIK